jgi:hypothetical protein
MLVALTIIVAIAMLALAVAPSLDSKTRSALGASQVQGWLFIAKQRALRDGLVCGVQLFPDPNNPTWLTQLRYVEQPGPFTQGSIGQGTTTNPATVTFNLPAGVDLRTVVLPNDYLIINGTDPYVVASVDLTTPNNLNLTTALVTPIPAGSAVPYKILRGPRPIDGEPDLLLPTDVIIDTALSVNIPVKNGVSTILFAPSGGAPQDGQSAGKIILWVRDSSRDLAFEGEPTLVTVFTRSGAIGAYPVNADSNGKTDSRGYYFFTQDGRTSGL